MVIKIVLLTFFEKLNREKKLGTIVLRIADIMVVPQNEHMSEMHHV